MSDIVPYSRYPGLPALFGDFLAGLPGFYPDAPTLEAAGKRGRELLGTPARIPADAFRFRHPRARVLAQELASGGAVAVVTGHQVGLFTGPLFTLVKAFDAIRVARQLSDGGLPAVPVFYALTDDHDLEEIARTARPGPEGPEILTLEGADRANRRPVGTLPIPPNIARVLDAFRKDARTPEGERILEAFARRSAPGTSYGDAFVETLLDLLEPEPLLVLDPLGKEVQSAAGELFQLATRSQDSIRETLGKTEQRLREERKPVPVALRPGFFPFFAIEKEERRRVEDLPSMLARLEREEVAVSADVLTRPVLKSFLLPTAASILGAAEIAYHAQALPLFPILSVRPPVLLPRSHLVLLGPAERRAVQALGIPRPDLLSPRDNAIPALPEEEALRRIAAETDQHLAALETGLRPFDPTLSGALETARRKVAYQLTQLEQRMRTAAERKDEVASSRQRRLDLMLRPGGTPAERVYPPLVPLLAFGAESLRAIRQGARGDLRGAVIVDLGVAAREGTSKPDGG
ncbi:MAG: bacillithiol biosynthesis protein BshC [Thermoanaerobaculia bacterium]